jgi:dolichyl-diphosphooligosaccharide---protein glycosyltransferase subunit 1 (ribophorin I)
VHIISVEKNYVKESINVVVENIAPGPQDEYFLPFTLERIGRVGGFEVKDRKDVEAGLFEVALVEYDADK